MSHKLVRIPGAKAKIRATNWIDRGERSTQETVIARAHERGRAEGVLAGMNIAHTQAAQALTAAMDHLDAVRTDAAADLARTAAELSVAIARRILRTEITAGRYDVETVVRETLHAASTQRSPCVVHLNPEDVEALRDVRFRSGTTLQSDPGVRRGDVQVETSLGLLVRDVDSILTEIGARLEEDLP